MEPSGTQKLPANTNLPENQAAQPKKEEGVTWVQWFGTGATSAISVAAGWQAKAVVGAWAPKLILDAAIAKSGYILGGGLYGPAAIEAAKPMITILAGGAGTLTTMAAAAGIYGAAKLGVIGANAVNAKLEERQIKNEMREYQLNPANKGDYDVKALDDWSELDTLEDKVGALKEKLRNETNSDIRIRLRTEIGHLEREIDVKNFKPLK